MRRLIPRRFERLYNFVDHNGGLLAFLIVVIASAIGMWQVRTLADNQNSEQSHRITQIKKLTTAIQQRAKETKRVADKNKATQVILCRIISVTLLDKPNLTVQELTLYTDLLQQLPACIPFNRSPGRSPR
jgi:hypothetical protein